MRQDQERIVRLHIERTQVGTFVTISNDVEATKTAYLQGAQALDLTNAPGLTWEKGFSYSVRAVEAVDADRYSLLTDENPEDGITEVVFPISFSK